jgi:hypothetical protein
MQFSPISCHLLYKSKSIFTLVWSDIKASIFESELSHNPPPGPEAHTLIPTLSRKLITTWFPIFGVLPVLSFWELCRVKSTPVCIRTSWFVALPMTQIPYIFGVHSPRLQNTHTMEVKEGRYWSNILWKYDRKWLRFWWVVKNCNCCSEAALYDIALDTEAARILSDEWGMQIVFFTLVVRLLCPNVSWSKLNTWFINCQ